MTFPIKVRVFHRRHTGGTKFYHIISLTNSAGRGLFIARYGKTGTHGKVDVMRCDTASDNAMKFNTKSREKNGRNYTIPMTSGIADIDTDATEWEIKSAADFKDARRFAGSTFRKVIEGLSREDRNHLMGDADIALNEADHAAVAAADNLEKAEEARKRKNREAAEVKERAEAAASLERSRASNSTWGMF